MYIDPTFVFHGEHLNTFKSLTIISMVIKHDWLFCYNFEDDPIVFKIVGVSHMVVMRSMAFLRQWKEVNKIDLEVILGEV